MQTRTVVLDEPQAEAEAVSVLFATALSRALATDEQGLAIRRDVRVSTDVDARNEAGR